MTVQAAREAKRAEVIAHLVSLRGPSRSPTRVNPLGVYDGWPLRSLMAMNDRASRDNVVALEVRHRFTPAQRAAVSACWTAELRAKVAASTAADKEREARRILVDLEDE